MVSNSRDAKTFFVFFVQTQSIAYTMPKKGKTKAKVPKEDSDLEISLGIKIYKDTKSVTRAHPKFKWG